MKFCRLRVIFHLNISDYLRFWNELLGNGSGGIVWKKEKQTKNKNKRTVTAVSKKLDFNQTRLALKSYLSRKQASLGLYLNSFWVFFEYRVHDSLTTIEINIFFFFPVTIFQNCFWGDRVSWKPCFVLESLTSVVGFDATSFQQVVRSLPGLSWRTLVPFPEPDGWPPRRGGKQCAGQKPRRHRKSEYSVPPSPPPPLHDIL